MIRWMDVLDRMGADGWELAAANWASEYVVQAPAAGATRDDCRLALATAHQRG